MTASDRPLIVGAGPVGLGAALFLAAGGVVPRLIDLRETPADRSKALAVNPRTLSILAPFGVTRAMLDMGLRIQGMRLSRRGRVVARVAFQRVHAEYPFMLALTQATTERLLTEALVAAGGRVERGTKLVACRDEPDGVEATLEHASGGPREVVRCPWLLAADGAHSDVRHQMGIDFPGATFAREWYLADVPLRTDLSADHANVVFLDQGGFQFFIRVVDGVSRDVALWRVVSDRPDPLSCLAGAEPAGPAIWSSSFRVAHRTIARMSSGNVHFAGDAAHVHSPIGARGMNLGLEDAWVFAHLALAGRLSEYDRLRRPVVQRVVRQVHLLSRMAQMRSRPARWVRDLALPRVFHLGAIQGRVARTVTGLDHDLPEMP